MIGVRVAQPLDLGSQLPEQLVDQPTLGHDGTTQHFILNGMVGPGAFERLQSGHPYGTRSSAGPCAMSTGVGNRKLFAITSEFMDRDTVNVRLPLGETEVWQTTNVSVMAHPFDMHGTSFLIRSRNGQAPAPHLRSWKDIVLVRGGETVELVVAFHHPADADHIFMYYCHIPEYEDNGMVGQFVVE